jgi:hypothetical protein
MSSYCIRQSIDPRSIRFLFDGATLQPKSTPESLGAVLQRNLNPKPYPFNARTEMEDGDEIDAMLSQVLNPKPSTLNPKPFIRLAGRVIDVQSLLYPLRSTTWCSSLAPVCHA